MSMNNNQQVYIHLKSFFSKEKLHKVMYKDTVWLYEDNSNDYDMPACVYVIDELLIEMLIPLISDAVIGLEWNGSKYEIVFKEMYSWRLHRLICKTTK